MYHHHKDPEWCREGGGGEKEIATNQWRKAHLTRNVQMCLPVAQNSVQKHDCSQTEF